MSWTHNSPKYLEKEEEKLPKCCAKGDRSTTLGEWSTTFWGKIRPFLEPFLLRHKLKCTFLHIFREERGSREGSRINLGHNFRETRGISPKFNKLWPDFAYMGGKWVFLEVFLGQNAYMEGKWGYFQVKRGIFSTKTTQIAYIPGE